MTFAQRRNSLTTHFSESIPVVNRGISVYLLGTIRMLCMCVYVCARACVRVNVCVKFDDSGSLYSLLLVTYMLLRRPVWNWMVLTAI
jgi:hypothetical protein